MHGFYKKINMKLVLMIMTICLVIQGVSQKPEKVYSIVKEMKSVDWYKTQADLWKKETDKNRKDANAWYNYFSAVRGLRNISPMDSEAREKYHKEGQEIANEAYKNIPNSFEANHLIWWQSSVNEKSKVSYLMRAYEIAPLDSRAYSDLLTHYALTNDDKLYAKFCVKFFMANEIPASVYNWAYNLLSELDQNAIVFTAGDNDTFSPWVLQSVKGVRNDVFVINTHLILKDEYRANLFKKIGLKPFNKSIEDIKTKEEHKAFKKELFDHMFKNDKGIPVYVSGSAILQFKSDYEDKLFLTGLAYKYSETALDNVALIRRNYEKRYLLDYLNETFSFNMMDKKSNDFNAIYLPAFVKLYKSYQKSEELSKLKQLEKQIIDISKKSGNETEINEILGEEKSSNILNSFRLTLLNTKTLEKNFIKLQEDIYLNKYELTNQDFQLFLNNVLYAKNIKLFSDCLYDSAQWVKKRPYEYNEPMRNMYHWHPAYANYPIVNVSQNAANEYCRWLTKQYNSQNKRRFTKVIFRLPTELEWMTAAGNGDPKSQTYFKNNSITKENKPDIYLTNLKIDGNPLLDGGFYTVKVDAYEPNQLGFFNMIGNVAEMVSESNKSKGGNWYLNLNQSKIPEILTFNGPDPGVGFRVLMEVIEF